VNRHYSSPRDFLRKRLPIALAVALGLSVFASVLREHFASTAPPLGAFAPPSSPLPGASAVAAGTRAPATLPDRSDLPAPLTLAASSGETSSLASPGAPPAPAPGDTDPLSIVRGALASPTDGALALSAVEVIDRCHALEGHIQSGLRARASLPAESARLITAMLEDMAQTQRHCQLLPPELLSQRDELARLALRLGVQGAAAQALSAPPGLEVPAALRTRPDLLDGLRRDGEAGHVVSLIWLSSLRGFEGLDAISRRSYELALAQLDPRTARKADDMWQKIVGFFPGWGANSLTEEEERLAQARADDIVRRSGKSTPPPTKP
jgi:hypothetical protein